MTRRAEQLAIDGPPAALRGPGAPCWWCGQPIPERSAETGRQTRSDAKTCSKRCRQSSWRFGDEQPAPSAVPGRPRTFAYADPPYPGMSERYYRDHPDFAGEVDHGLLLDRLIADYQDGWALSTSSKTLGQVIGLLTDRKLVCGADYRIGAWTKPAPPSSTRRPRDAWEPVIFAGGRPRPRDARLLLNWVHSAPPRTFPGQITGIKPAAFSFWVFDSLGALPGDRLDDLFPGSGAVAVAWERWTRDVASSADRRVA